MPYKQPGHIEVPLKTREKLDRLRDYDETWDTFLLELAKYWIEGHKKN
jgi:hypothetical protein